jgi:site-specific DNA recombinase
VTKDDATVNAAVYTRISDDKAGDSHGVDDQEARCRQIAEARGYGLVETYVDNDLSAFSGKARPAWARMLADLNAGRVKDVVAYASDRLYRRTRDQLDLMEAVKRAEGKIVTVLEGETDPASAEGRMRMTILSSVAEFESSRKAERVRSRIETNAAQDATTAVLASAGPSRTASGS